MVRHPLCVLRAVLLLLTLTRLPHVPSHRTLFVLWIVFLLLAAYCEMVVPSAVGIKAHPLFCVRPSWWRRTCARRHSAEKLQQSTTVPTLPADVAAERQAVWNGGKTADAIRLLDLRVVYVRRAVVGLMLLRRVPLHVCQSTADLCVLGSPCTVGCHAADTRAPTRVPQTRWLWSR